jgi:CheY-like chemotaxis protein
MMAGAELMNRPLTEADAARVRVVLVEDDEPTRQALRRLLELGGYEVIEAGNGRDGIRTVRDCLPDVVVTDVLMPIIDGIGVARALRDDRATRNIPIIAATGENISGSHREQLFDTVLRKPFDPKDLLLAVARLIASFRRDPQPGA